MPIRAELLPLYPLDWPEISRRIRFERADGRCEQCGRPHGWVIYQSVDGRWFDAADLTWRDDWGEPAARPTELLRLTQVVLTTAHLAHDPRQNADADLAALCTRCHLAHDLQHHRRQRWLRYRLRWAIADLFLGRYGAVYPRNS